MNMLPLKTSLVQNAWVVANLESAMRGWLAMGVGPFFVLHQNSPDAMYRGRPVPLSFRVGLAQAGPIQIELIEQLSDGPSAYRDVVPPGHSGFHHMCKLTDDYAGDTKALMATGIVLATEINVFGLKACYADTRQQMGCMLELVPPLPQLLKLYEVVATAARDWSGADPVREFSIG
jgi:Glyoxalase/Bleomycin resistance protein/Dioxygenase superfamily